MLRTVRWTFAAIALVVASFTVGVVALSAPAGAQQATVDIGDFTDPITGEVDFDAYLAALNAAQQRGDGVGVTTGDDGIRPATAVTTGGNLPFTGSSVTDFVVLGVGLAIVGGGAYAVARQRHAHQVA
jgi:hypothetical protein